MKNNIQRLIITVCIVAMLLSGFSMAGAINEGQYLGADANINTPWLGGTIKLSGTEIYDAGYLQYIAKSYLNVAIDINNTFEVIWAPAGMYDKIDEGYRLYECIDIEPNEGNNKFKFKEMGLYIIRVYEGETRHSICIILELPTEATALPTASTVLIDGKKVSFDAYNINGNNYFKIRDIAYVLNKTDKQFNLEYNQELKRVSMILAKQYKPLGDELKAGGTELKKAVLSTDTTMVIDGGWELEYNLAMYKIDGYNYYKLRDLASVVNFGLTWDGNNNTIKVDTTTWYTPE